MRSSRRIALGLAAALAIAGCNASTSPSPTSSGAAPDPSLPDTSADPGAEPTSPVVGQLAGSWRRSQIVLDDAHIAIISDACAAEARKTLDDDAADLPTALIDAQGDNYAIAILADDLDAIDCLVNLDGTGGVLSIESVDRLSKRMTAAVDGSKLSLASLIHAYDGSRTIAFGRVGPDASKVHAAFDDQTYIHATPADGWWAMWWKGTVKAATFAAVDSKNVALAAVPAPAGEIEARLKRGEWWVDPAAPRPSARSTKLGVFVSERECSSGRSLEGLVDPPAIGLGERDVTVTF